MEEPNIFTGQCGFGHRKLTVTDTNNQFVIDDLLVDFPNHDDVVLGDDFFIGNSADSSTVTVVDSCNSSVAVSEALFSAVEHFLPYDDVEDLEWLSSFTQESFTIVDVQNLQIISAEKKSPSTDTSSSGTTPVAPYRINSQIFQTDVFVPGKARSKRSRTVPYDWTSRVLHLKSRKTIRFKKREVSVMRCLHCGSEKTPQWRSGPLGPKTLCNACGVRYNSGRLVPEYRPAASPTFMSAKYSNSHRKVMEIRRQKELQIQNRSSIVVGSNDDEDDYCLID